MGTLADSPCFAALPAPTLAVLAAAAQPRRYPAGSLIFRQGDPGDGVYVVREGLVEIAGQLGANPRQVFSRLGPGELFGEMAVIEDQPRSADAVAARDTTADFIPREALLAAVRLSPELALSLLREISQRLREFNRHYLADLLHAERLATVGWFARSVIHDLKNPLNTISLTAELTALDTATPAQRQQARERIRRQVVRITDLVNAVLDYTQGRSADDDLSPTDYAAFITQTAAELRADLELRSVQLELENAPPAVLVRLDPRRLSRVLHNLAHNAADAMPGGGRLRLRFASEPGSVTTEVEDTGPGLPPEVADRLFEPFATHGKTCGTGLGLAICKKIIEDHDGRIWARIEPGRGAIFAFSLPVAQPGQTQARTG